MGVWFIQPGSDKAEGDDRLSEIWVILTLEVHLTLSRTMRASTRLRNTAPSKCLPPTIRARLTPSTGSSSKGECQETINGWLKSVRGHKNVLFAEVTDGSTSEGLQAVFKGTSRVPGLDAGASVRLRGKLVESRGAGQAKELVVDTAEVIGECDPEVRISPRPWNQMNDIVPIWR
jgi:hypothetical protein